jgi:prefoldin subunit 5
MLAGVVQNPDYVDENNCKENLEQFNKEYDYIIEKLSEIRQEVENLHNEIGANRK